ncbi:MAG: TPM domain-containing protein [Prevotella sp.]|nr:TPM domain-containing protein [Prevotella sp.]
MKKKTDEKLDSTLKKGIIIAIILVVAWPLGRFFGTSDMSSLVFWILLCVMAAITAIAFFSPEKERKEYVKQKQAKLDADYNEFNQNVNQLISEHKQKKKELRTSFIGQDLLDKDKKKQTNELRKSYSAEYAKLHNSFKRKAEKAEKETPPVKSPWAARFKMLPVAAIAASLFAWGSDSHEQHIAQELYEATDTKAWVVNDIPMVHLQDSRCYVSNPDTVLQQQTVAKLDSMYKYLDDSLGIESAIIVVNHVKDANVESFAQELGNKYGVGREDRGLVMVLAYRDKLFRIHTGRSLEADLTDAECSNMQQQYFVPAMKKEMPDSAMLYITKAIVNFFQKKEMPQLPFLDTKDDDSSDAGNNPFHYIFVFIGWIACFFGLDKRLGWSSLNTHLYDDAMKNPFVEHVASSGGSSSSSSSSYSSSSSSSSGGSYGGGSFGGGGSTTSW